MFWIEYIVDLLVLSVSVLHVELHFVSHFEMDGGHTLPTGQIIPPTQLVPAVQLLPVGHSELVIHPLHEGQ